MYVSVSTCVCVSMLQMCMVPLKSEEDTDSPGVRGIGGCELPNMGAGNLIQFL